MITTSTSDRIILITTCAIIMLIVSNGNYVEISDIYLSKMKMKTTD